MVRPLRAALAQRRAGDVLHLQLHQALRGEADHLAQQIGVGALLQESLEAHHLVGHRRVTPSCVEVRNPNRNQSPAMTTAEG
jgi:hypothetical protein